MIQVMADPSLHVQASKGYKYTGTTVALDGGEDAKFCTGAKDAEEVLDVDADE